MSGSQVLGLAGILGRHESVVVLAPTGCLEHIFATASDHACIKSLISLSFETVRSNEAKCNLSWWGVAMPPHERRGVLVTGTGGSLLL